MISNCSKVDHLYQYIYFGLLNFLKGIMGSDKTEPDEILPRFSLLKVSLVAGKP